MAIYYTVAFLCALQPTEKTGTIKWVSFKGVFDFSS
jgi:hypothetical protein